MMHYTVEPPYDVYTVERPITKGDCYFNRETTKALSGGKESMCQYIAKRNGKGSGHRLKALSVTGCTRETVRGVLADPGMCFQNSPFNPLPCRLLLLIQHPSQHPSTLTHEPLQRDCYRESYYGGTSCCDVDVLWWILGLCKTPAQRGFVCSRVLKETHCLAACNRGLCVCMYTFLGSIRHCHVFCVLHMYHIMVHTY